MNLFEKAAQLDFNAPAEHSHASNALNVLLTNQTQVSGTTDNDDSLAVFKVILPTRLLKRVMSQWDTVFKLLEDVFRDSTFNLETDLEIGLGYDSHISESEEECSVGNVLGTTSV